MGRGSRLASRDARALGPQDNRTKRQFLDDWVRAINTHDGFGTWAWDVSVSQDDLPDIIAKHAGAEFAPAGASA